MTLPRETSVAKSLDFNRLFRISPQSSNSLNGDGDPQHQADIQLQAQQHGNSIPTNLQDDSQYYVSRLYAEKQPTAESRALDASLQRGTWESFLVFGMICAAIVASMGSVLWFIRSYRSINSAHEETIRRITDDSSDTSSSISYDSSLSEVPNSSAGNPDFEPEVELDFEFSEDINRPGRNNISRDVILNINSSSSFSTA